MADCYGLDKWLCFCGYPQGIKDMLEYLRKKSNRKVEKGKEYEHRGWSSSWPCYTIMVHELPNILGRG